MYEMKDGEQHTWIIYKTTATTKQLYFIIPTQRTIAGPLERDVGRLPARSDPALPAPRQGDPVDAGLRGLPPRTALY